MPTLWIVHRDARVRGGLARLAAAGSDALLGEPSDRAFETTAAPRLVLLGVEGDLEAELEFAHRHAARIPEARWILLPRPGSEGEVARLFDTLPAEILTHPPGREHLRRRIRSALAATPAEALSERRVRDALSDRFSRFFADLELPQLLRALDPRLRTVPLLVRGEPGSGRSLLVHYVHCFSGGSQSGFVRVPCEAIDSSAAVREAIRDAAGLRAGARPSTVCLENLDRLSRALQRELRAWIETAMPPGMSGARRTRWAATLGDALDAGLEEGIDPSLVQSLAGIAIRIPPLRERLPAVGPFAAATALEWCKAHGEQPRQFGPAAVEALCEYPWPGNLRELEAVVARTLAAGSWDPIEPEQLRFDETEETAEIGARAEPEERGKERAGAAESPQVEPAAPRAEEPERAPPTTARNDLLQRLVSSLAHQVRNPLVAIRTFASLLPERFEDPEFRGRFHDIVGSDLGRIERVLEQLSGFAALGRTRTAPVNVAALLDQLLEERRSLIQERKLLVLKEIDTALPLALCDEAQLRFALGSLLDRAFDWVPERADLYLASKHHPTGLRGGPAVRVLIRSHGPSPGARAEGAGDAEGLSLRHTAIEIVLAELVVGSQGGTLTVDTTDGDETIILLDLPAPA